MSQSFTNRTRDDPGCESVPGYLVSLGLINLFSLAVGQPVNCRLLWTTCTSSRSSRSSGSSGSCRSSRSWDILNCNLALFHSFLYLVSVLYLVFLMSVPHQRAELLGVLLVYAQTGGPMSLAFICGERYVAVLHPTSYPLLKTYRCRELCAAVVWVSSLSIAIATSLTRTTVPALGGSAIRFVPLFVMVLATSLMAWSSLRIARALRRSGPGGDRLHPQKRRAFRRVCATMTLNLLCYIPVALMDKVQVLDPLSQCTLTPVCILVLAAGSVVHPVLYLSSHRKLSTCWGGHRKSP